MKQEQLDARTEIDQLAPGIARAQLPIALPGLGHVNCYLLEDERGIAVVDPGLPGDEPWQHLTDRLAAAQVPLTRVHTIVVTHSHPDHFGGAARLAEASGAQVVTHEHFGHTFELDVDDDLDEEQMAMRWQRPTPWGGLSAGPPPEARARYLELHRRGHFFPSPTTRLRDADTIRLAGRDWVAVHTPGHTSDHLPSSTRNTAPSCPVTTSCRRSRPHIGALRKYRGPWPPFASSTRWLR
ncbi:MAG: MBL fold metallo-hydrolase [Ilumatobacteraceae bacterium]